MRRQRRNEPFFAPSRLRAKSYFGTNSPPRRFAPMLTEHHDLRSGPVPWDDTHDLVSDPMPTTPVDIAIIGAGVMGGMLAERLSAAGKSVALLDRRTPGSGSTSASTALVLWEMDVPLSHLARRIGEEAAVVRWRRVAETVARLGQRIDGEALDAERIPRLSLYLDGDLLDEAGLRDEAALRRRHGLPSDFLTGGAVAERFDIAARPALVSGDSFEVEPVKLTRALLARARANGATVTFPCDVTALSHHPDSVTLTTDQGELTAAQVILAGGYERAPLFLPPAFSLHSSYAVATAPGIAPLWRENAMIWEASESYLYARADADGRIIAGGGDEEFGDAAARDRLIPEKAAEIAAGLSDLTGTEIAVRDRWAAMFGSSPDGLPAIGRARPGERVWLASGFGGNGVSFAALAAELLTAELTGRVDPDLALFDPYRFGA